MRRVGNTAIAAVTVVALCSGAWLLSHGDGSGPPPQPSAAEARTGQALRAPAAPALAPPHRTASASRRSASTRR